MQPQIISCTLIANEFTYTTEEHTPELLLSITDPDGKAVTTIEGLTYSTVNGVSGFDITTKTGLVKLATDYTIHSTNSTTGLTQNWNITVTFVNLKTNQTANAGKSYSANVIIQRNLNQA